MIRWLIAIFFALNLLPQFGCLVSRTAADLGGYYEPSAEARYSWLLGASLRLGTSFIGDAEYDKETGAWKVHVDSKPEPVLAGQAERAVALENLRKIEAEANVAIAQAWSQAMVQSIGALAASVEKISALPSPSPSPPELPLGELTDLLTPTNLERLRGLLGPAPPPTPSP